MARASLALSLPAESLVDLLETDPVDWTRVVFTWPPPSTESLEKELTVEEHPACFADRASFAQGSPPGRAG
jgi:hypothetical protein